MTGALTLSQGLTPWQLDKATTDWLAEHDPDGHWESRQYRETHKCHQSLPAWAEDAHGADVLELDDLALDIAPEDVGMLAEIRHAALKDRLMVGLVQAGISAPKRKIWDLVLDGVSQAHVAEWLGISDQAVSKAVAQSRDRVLWLARAVVRQEQAAHGDRLPMPETPIPDMTGAVQLGLFDNDGGDE